MKTAIKKTKMITMGLISIFIMGTTQSSFANNGKDPVELKAISNLNKQPVFQLKMNNADAGQFVVRIKDGNGDVLYSETLKGKDVTRTYKFDINEESLFDSFNVRFEITSVKTNETFIYNATSNNREVHEIIVAKL